MMIQHVFTFERVALGKPPAPSRWHVTLATAESLEIVAALEFVPGMQAWRLKAYHPLPLEEAAWSHPAYPASAKPRMVPAWLQREVIAQLAFWGLAKLLGRTHALAPVESREGN